MAHTIISAPQLRRYQFILLVFLSTAVCIEFLARFMPSEYGVLEQVLSLAAVMCLIASLSIISRYFSKAWYVKTTFFLAGSAAILAGAMRLFRELSWFPNFPIVGSEHAYFGPVLSLADMGVVSLLVIGFVLIILELSNTRIELSEKSSRLEKEMAVRRKAEKERLSLESKLWHAQKSESIGLLAGGIAHDFNNLLMGIMGNADILREDMREVPEPRKRLETIIAASKQASELTKQLLAYAGRGQFLQEPVNLSDLIQDLIALLHTSYPPHADLRFELAESLPSVECDHAQLRQVVINLVTNAVESLEGRNGQIQVRTEVLNISARDLKNAAVGAQHPPGRYVAITVVDCGVGMDERVRQRIFDPYFSTKSPGRGLGLSTVLGVVKGNEGALFVDSQPGSGTKMQVVFPVSELPAVAIDDNDPGSMAAARTGTVLMADDEAILRNLADDILSRYGFRVIQAENGQEAIDLYHRHRDEIDVVILDIVMPILTGDEAYRHIRQDSAKVPILISSGNNDRDVQQLVDGDENSALLSKPYRSRDMIGMLSIMLDGETADVSR